MEVPDPRTRQQVLSLVRPTGQKFLRSWHGAGSITCLGWRELATRRVASLSRRECDRVPLLGTDAVDGSAHLFGCALLSSSLSGDVMGCARSRASSMDRGLGLR